MSSDTGQFQRPTMHEITDTLARQETCEDDTRASQKVPAPVIVAVELTGEAEAALLWACEYAEATGAPLEILHVVHDSGSSPGLYKPDGDDPLEPMVDVAQRKLQRFLEQLEHRVPRLSGIKNAKRICVDGLPAQRILDVARAHGTSLLVLGSCWRNGFGRLLHGSTASQVLRQANFPVTIVKADGG